MKLRLSHDMMRLRLDAAETARLAAEGRLEEAARFGPGPNDAIAWAIELIEEMDAAAGDVEFPGRAHACHIGKCQGDDPGRARHGRQPCPRRLEG